MELVKSSEKKKLSITDIQVRTLNILSQNHSFNLLPTQQREQIADDIIVDILQHFIDTDPEYQSLSEEERVSMISNLPPSAFFENASDIIDLHLKDAGIEKIARI